MNSKRIVYLAVIGVIALTAALSVLVTQILDGSSMLAWRDPLAWLATANSEILAESLATATGVMLALLGLAITVVAIVVELAATRYNHRITSLFIREPINIAVLSFFVITTIECLWASAMLPDAGSNAVVPRAGFAVSYLLVTASLLLALPYFGYVISYVSPLNMIDKINQSGMKAFSSAVGNFQPKQVETVNEAVDELHDVVRSAMEQGDRSVAMAGVDAMAHLISIYQEKRSELPQQWFQINEALRKDPDFVSLERFAVTEIEHEKSWFEVKLLRQYLLLMMVSASQMRDIAYLIAINTRQIAIDSIERSPTLLNLCIRCFNSYLRSSINAGDVRTSYYLLNQYRLVAEAIEDGDDLSRVVEIARHFQYYGRLAFDLNQPFLLEVAAYDVMRLLDVSSERGRDNTDDLLRLLLDFDYEIKLDSQIDSLLGIRRAQIQAATMLIERGDLIRAKAIAEDLAGEDASRLERVREGLASEDRAQYWELTDRGITFAYLAPELRRHLDTLFKWIRS